MTQPFTPKFVDMVRVSTSTQGTGPLVCGPAIAGFASFADTLTVGDTFYYSVQGIEKPQEREVGRGTYGANNTIVRQPLRGTLTSFTSGSKTIALIAASEWYARVQELTATLNKLSSVESRTALKQLTGMTKGEGRNLEESGREGRFVWNPLTPIAIHQADPAEGIYVAPNPGTVGAWVRRFEGPLNIRWFGAIGDNATNDGPAFLAALAFIRASASSNGGYGNGASRLHIPRGQYFLSTATLDLFDASFILEGDGIGLSGGAVSALRWSANTTGIRVQGEKTSGANGTRPRTYLAGRSVIRGLFLRGGYEHGSTPEGEFHGIHLRDAASIEHCHITRFQGDGIFVSGDVNFDSNSNLAEASKVTVESCRNGVYLQGGDANACSFYHVNVASNRQWGIWDRSFLGNSFIGCHSASNGIFPGNGASVIPPNRVVMNNLRFAVVIGEEAWCSVNAPSGTTADNRGWLFAGEGGEEAWNNITGWVNGRLYRAGGSYAVTDPNARSVFMSCYSEGDMAPNQIRARSMLQGGIHENGTRGNAPYIYGEFDGLRVANSLLTAQSGLRAWGTVELGDASKQWQGASICGSNYGELGFKIAFQNAGRVYADSTNGLRIAGNTFVSVELAGGAAVANLNTHGVDLAAGKNLHIAGLKVVGGRETGWTAATGTPNKGVFAAAAPGTVSATYVQGELQGALDRTAAAEARIVALEAAMRGHGLIN